MWALLTALFGLWQLVIDPIETTPIETMPPDPFLEPDNIPAANAPFTYLGSGTVPQWSDVYDTAEAEYAQKALLPDQDPTDGTVKWVIYTGKVAIGETIKAMSGMVNNAVDDALQNVNLLSTITDAEIFQIMGRLNKIANAVNQIVPEVNAITLFTVRYLESKIDNVAERAQNVAKFYAAVERQWAIDHILKPLFQEATTVQPKIDLAVAHEHQAAIDYTDVAVAALGVRVLSALAPIQTAIATLQAESENCTKPMCETMGPNTGLGKFLKGLNIAADAALIAALLGMTESDLAGFITSLTSHVGTVIGDVEQFLGPGGETVAGLIAAATGDLI